MVLDAFRLDGRVALVTGAARGMGEAMALAVAEAGGDVGVLDLDPTTQVCRQIRDRGRRYHTLARDLQKCSPTVAAAILEEVVEALGRFDILINNAGIIHRAPAVDVTADNWERVLQVNLTSLFYLSQAAGRYFITHDQPGRIINVASMLSFQGGLGVPAYAAAKTGVLGLTRALANEWAPHRVNVNAVAPGWIATEFTTGLRTDSDRFEQISSRIPAGRWGTVRDVQGAVVFLASDASEYVHGAVIPVDGGWLAW